MKLFRFYRLDIGDYMHRWIFEHPFGTLRLHHILRSDQDRALHDHPWWFVSLLLGPYIEVRPVPGGTPGRSSERKVFHRRFSIVFRRSTDAHRLIVPKPVWTIVISGRKSKRWGFFLPTGWKHWKECESLWSMQSGVPVSEYRKARA